jgi:hypothetical protein
MSAYRDTPREHKSATNANGYAWLGPDLVVLVFKDDECGMGRADIATKRNISQHSVKIILYGPEWFRARMTRYGGKGWTYPTRKRKG